MPRGLRNLRIAFDESQLTHFGRMELELSDFHLPQAIENALTLVRERGAAGG